MANFAQVVYWEPLARAFKLLVASSVVWLPLVLVYLAIWLWLFRARARWINELDWVLLEIKLPKEIAKTPAAMELVLGVFNRPERDDLINKWLKGEQRIWGSLEIASLGGEVKFFIHCKRESRNQVEAAVYAKYPNVEIFEAEDYTNKIPYGLPADEWKLWGFELVLAKEDAYPLKTYLDYGMDEPVDPKMAGAQVDPLTHLIEYFATLKPDEQMWVQILVRGTMN